MKGFLFVCVMAVAVIAGLGFYRGWFQVSTENADHKPNVTFTVDEDKFQEDKQKATEKVQDLGHKVKEKTGPGDHDKIQEDKAKAKEESQNTGQEPQP